MQSFNYRNLTSAITYLFQVKILDNKLYQLYKFLCDLLLLKAQNLHPKIFGMYSILQPSYFLLSCSLRFNEMVHDIA